MRPYGVRGVHGVSVAQDFAVAVAMSQGLYQGKTFHASAKQLHNRLVATIAAANYDTAYRLFKSLLKAEGYRSNVKEIVIVPEPEQARA